ncbi:MULTISPECIES: HAD-IIA family hydrolase [Methylobacter]|jgi:HAD superfamily hydrolase (TIGR01457 family)|uniref:HAD-IIA family hydrolase n=1 Tax=Methylobacter TaxID=429 RepID=UPI000374C688|nr:MULTISPECIES: HAD-IIA family hydrolase [Methylobacter]
MESFTNIRAFIIDMDGVLWHGEQAQPGLQDFFQALHDNQIRFILATNNASLTPEQYVAKLARMGITTVDRSNILTSATATALYLAERNPPENTRIFIVGEDGLRQPLLDQGFMLTGLYEVNTDTQENLGAHIVVCGKDQTLTWDKLATATLNIRAGADFIGTNGDTTLPTEHGVTHGNGAILAALQVATGISPTIIGKPEPIIYQQALALLGVKPSETVAIGDRLETDILGAVRTGIRSLLVLSGISTEEDVKKSNYQPTWVMPDIRAVTEALRDCS